MGEPISTPGWGNISRNIMYKMSDQFSYNVEDWINLAIMSSGYMGSMLEGGD